jgi:hypothetical protein
MFSWQTKGRYGDDAKKSLPLNCCIVLMRYALRERLVTGYSFTNTFLVFCTLFPFGSTMK